MMQFNGAHQRAGPARGLQWLLSKPASALTGKQRRVPGHATVGGRCDSRRIHESDRPWAPKYRVGDFSPYGGRGLVPS